MINLPLCTTFFLSRFRKHTHQQHLEQKKILEILIFQSGKWTTSADCVFLYPVFSQTAYAGQNTVTSKNGLLKDSDGVWRYYTNNQVDTSYTGFAASGSDQVYLINGVQNTSYSGLIYNGGNWYYVQKRCT